MRTPVLALALILATPALAPSDLQAAPRGSASHDLQRPGDEHGDLVELVQCDR